MTEGVDDDNDNCLSTRSDDDDKAFSAMDPRLHSMDCSSSTDVFYDTTDLFTGLDDTDLFSDLDLLSDSRPTSGVDLLADCESLPLPLVHDGNGEMIQTMENLLSQAGIQQPAQRQIRLHSDLAHHLSTSPANSDPMLGRPDSMPVKTQMSSSSQSESELVRMLTSVLEDGTSSLTRQQLLPRRPQQQLQQQQHVPMAAVPASAKDLLAASSSCDSELARQLSLCPDDFDDDDKHSLMASNDRQQQQRVALVQPTVTHRAPMPLHPASDVKMIDPQQHHHQSTSRLSVQDIEQIIQQQQQSKQPSQATQIVITTSPSQGPPTVLQTAQHGTTQAVAGLGGRQIVITTQAPVQTQHVPQISLQQLQQVMPDG